jgi:hypothetical protein
MATGGKGGKAKVPEWYSGLTDAAKARIGPQLEKQGVSTSSTSATTGAKGGGESKAGGKAPKEPESTAHKIGFAAGRGLHHVIHTGSEVTGGLLEGLSEDSDDVEVRIIAGRPVLGRRIAGRWQKLDEGTWT